MGQYLVVNPAAGNDYFTVAGAAVGAASQPAVNNGRATALGGSSATTSANMGKVAAGTPNLGVFASQVVTGNDIGSAQWGTNVSAGVSVAAASGFAVYTKNSHGLLVGAVVNVTDTNSKVNGTQRITAKDTNTFTTTKAYTSGAGTVTYYPASGNFATLTAGSYVIRRVTTSLAGVANTVLLTGASNFGNRRSIHQVESVRTRRVATAIRAGYYSIYDGTWSTAPTLANDISTWETIGTDEAANPTASVPGEIIYKTGKPVPVQGNYPARSGVA
jgi:hypothetical protein